MKDHVFAVNATLIGLGAVQLAERRFAEARANLDKALSALGSACDPAERELYAVALRFHADLLSDQNNTVDAERELKAAIAILESLGAEAAVQLAYTLSDLGGLYISLGRFSEASAFIPRALRLLASTVGSDNSEYARANMIYDLCISKGEHLMENAQIAGIKLQYKFGAKHPSMLRAARRYVAALEARGETAELEEAREIFAAFNGNKTFTN